MDLEEQFNEALEKIRNYTPKCPECGAELPTYPYYMSNSHGDAIEVWICDKCGKYLERG